MNLEIFTIQISIANCFGTRALFLYVSLSFRQYVLDLCNIYNGALLNPITLGPLLTWKLVFNMCVYCILIFRHK